MKLSKLLIPSLFLLIFGVVVFIFSQKKQPDLAKTPVEQEQSTNTLSRYVKYSSTELDQYKSKRRVLYFYASWCPICRPADTDFTVNSDKIPEDVVIIRVNYNDQDTEEAEKVLAKKYAITYQHTFVQIDSDGNEIKKWNGGELDELLVKIKSVSVSKQATFSIITNGVSRVFTSAMYHNLSKDVYIEESDPSVIQVRRSGITWNDFFLTLPFKLSHSCLTTGTKETFCTGTNGTLRFFLNGTEVKQILNLEIQNGDDLKITFGS